MFLSSFVAIWPVLADPGLVLRQVWNKKLFLCQWQQLQCARWPSDDRCHFVCKFVLNHLGPFSMRLIWSELTYTYRKKWYHEMIYHRKIPGDKQILLAQSGHIESGTTTAIIGPSGAGKTTLLNIISGRLGIGVQPSWFVKLFTGPLTETVHSESVTGKVAVRFDTPNMEEDKARFRIGFVPHKDNLLSQCTIRETLIFAMKMNDEKGQWNLSSVERVETILALFKLNSVAETRISKLTTLQNKFTSIAAEMVSNPQVLVLEGPTEDLDWNDSGQVIKILSKVTQKLNVATACTMYNTPFDLLCEFDKLYIFSKLGSCVYFDRPQKLVPTLINCRFPVPPDVNPGEYAVEIAGGKFGLDNLTSLTIIAAKATESDALLETDVPIAQLNCHRIVAPFSRQVWLLFTRSFFRQIFRSRVALFKLLWPLIAVLCLSNIYQSYPGLEDGCWATIMMNNTHHQYQEKLKSLNSNISLIISALLLFSIVPCATNVMGVQAELLTARKEIKNSWYSIYAYSMGRMFVDLVMTTVTVAPAAICLYYSSKQIEGTERVYIFVWTLVVYANTWSSKGFVFSTLLAPGILGLIFTVVLEFIAMFLTGSQVKRERFFCLLKALNPLSDAKMAFELMVLSVYGYGRCVPSNETVDSSVNYNVNYIFEPGRMHPLEIAYEFWPKNDTCELSNATHMEPLFNETFRLTEKDFSTKDDWSDHKFSYILSLWDIRDSELFVRFLVIALKYLLVRVVVYFRLLYTFKVLMKFDEFDGN